MEQELEFGRQLARRRRRRPGPAPAGRDSEDVYEPDGAVAVDSAQPLMDALERLRITGGGAPGDPGTGRILRGRRIYQEQTTTVVLANGMGLHR